MVSPLLPATPKAIKEALRVLLKSQDAVDDLLASDETVYAANILITFPGFLRWLRVNDPIRNHGDLANKVSFYNSGLRGYEHWVTKLLDRIGMSKSGKALMAEIARSKHQVRIGPAAWDDTNAHTFGDDDEDSTPKGEWVRNSDGSLDDPPERGTGKGTDATIEFTPDTWSSFTKRGPGNRPDESLFHELVHAAADLNGAITRLAVNQQFDNEAEFIAIVVENIYLSEKGRGLRADHGRARAVMVDPDTFLDHPDIAPKPRHLLKRFRSHQHHFFNMLAAIPAPVAKFNPIRQLNNEMKQSRARP